MALHVTTIVEDGPGITPGEDWGQVKEESRALMVLYALHQDENECSHEWCVSRTLDGILNRMSEGELRALVVAFMRHLLAAMETVDLLENPDVIVELREAEEDAAAGDLTPVEEVAMERQFGETPIEVLEQRFRESEHADRVQEFLDNPDATGVRLQRPLRRTAAVSGVEVVHIHADVAPDVTQPIPVD